MVYSGDMRGATIDIAMRWLGHLKKTNTFTVDSKLAASGHSSKLAASGDYSIAMAPGPGSIASVGKNGTIALAWWDSAAERYRVVVGYAGEDGIEAGVVYRVEDGKLAPVKKEAAT